jgi:hypothetical protein
LPRLRLLASIFVVVLLAAGLVACGGDDDGGGADEDPQKVLDETFTGDHEDVESGNFSLTFNADVSGPDGGQLDLELGGPFETQGENEVPRFDISANASATGEDAFDFEGGLISTGDAAFVSYKGTDYEVDQGLFDRFSDQVESAQGEEQEQNEQSVQRLLDALGIEDPTELLTNLTNEGTADVEGTETVHVSGDLDVDRTVEAFKSLIANASLLGQLGGGTSQLPDPEQLDQVKDAIKEAHFDLYSGADDNILRRLQISIVIEQGDNSADLGFDFTLSGVNESQTIDAPSGARPFRDLLEELGVGPEILQQLGGIGALGGGAGGGAPIVPGGGAGQSQQLQYLQCLSQARSAAQLQECEELLPSG